VRAGPTNLPNREFFQENFKKPGNKYNLLSPPSVEASSQNFLLGSPGNKPLQLLLADFAVRTPFLHQKMKSFWEQDFNN
jgi:hypothetical protein